jgi:hypothetical protein
MGLPGFDQHFNAILAHWETKSKQLQGPKQMRTFNETNKAKKTKGGQQASSTTQGGLSRS